MCKRGNLSSHCLLFYWRGFFPFCNGNGLYVFQYLIHQKTTVRNTSHLRSTALWSADKERRADELIQAYRENGFRSVLLSDDLEKPNALYGTVYRSSVGMKYQEPVFTFRYIQKEGTLGAEQLGLTIQKNLPSLSTDETADRTATCGAKGGGTLLPSLVWRSHASDIRGCCTSFWMKVQNRP